MKTLKRLLGFLWLAFAAAAAYFCIFIFGLPKLLSSQQEDIVFGVIILFILTPLIVVGLGLFGWYALRGEYEN